jgi:hypothetical protein
VKPPAARGRNLTHGGVEAQRHAALLHGGGQRLEERLKAAHERAQARGARVQARPHPGHVDVGIVLAELAHQQRFPQRVVHALAHVLAQPLLGRHLLQRLPVGAQLELQAGPPEADHVAQREMPQQKERHVGEHRVEGMEVALIVDGRDRPREQHFIARPDLVDQAQHVLIGLEPVMVELLHRPVPVRFLEPGGQPAHLRRGLVDGDLLAPPGQIIGGGQAGRAGPDDGDVARTIHGVDSLSRNWAALVKSPQRSPSRIM